MNKMILIGIILFGIILIIIGLYLIGNKMQVKLIGERIVNNATITFSNENSEILVFNATLESKYRLKITVEPLETIYGGIKIKPLIYFIVVDQEGFNNIKSNKTLSYIYLKVEALEEKMSYNIDNINSSKRFYAIFSTPLPEQRVKVDVDMIYSKYGSIELLDIGIIASGIIIVCTSLIFKRLTK